MKEISAGALKLYLYLLRCRNQETGQCNPSASTCAEAIDVQTDHIYKLRRELAEKQWVSFDYGAATILLDVNPVKNDRVSKMTGPNPVKKDGETLSKKTVNPVKNATTCKEEQDERTRRKNKTNSAGAGAEAPPASESPPPLDANKTVWQLGVGLLKSVGEPEEHARSFLGKMAKDYGKERLAQAIVSAMAAEPISPKEYLVKVLQGGANGKSSGSSYDQERKRRAKGVRGLFRANKARRPKSPERG